MYPYDCNCFSASQQRNLANLENRLAFKQAKADIRAQYSPMFNFQNPYTTYQPSYNNQNSMSGMMDMMSQMMPMMMMCKMMGIDLDFGSMFKAMNNDSTTTHKKEASNNSSVNERTHVAAKKPYNCGCNKEDKVEETAAPEETAEINKTPEEKKTKPAGAIPQKDEPLASPNFTTGDNDIDKQMKEYIKTNPDNVGQTINLQKMQRKNPDLYNQVLSNGITYNETSELTVDMKKNSTDVLNLNLGKNASKINIEGGNVEINTESDALNIIGDKNSTITGIQGNNLESIDISGKGVKVDADLEGLSNLKELNMTNALISTNGLNVNSKNPLNISLDHTYAAENGSGMNVSSPEVNADISGNTELNYLSILSDDAKLNISDATIDDLSVNSTVATINTNASDFNRINLEESAKASISMENYTFIDQIDASEAPGAVINLGNAEPNTGYEIEILRPEGEEETSNYTKVETPVSTDLQALKTQKKELKKRTQSNLEIQEYEKLLDQSTIGKNINKVLGRNTDINGKNFDPQLQKLEEDGIIDENGIILQNNPDLMPEATEAELDEAQARREKIVQGYKEMEELEQTKIDIKTVRNGD